MFHLYRIMQNIPIASIRNVWTKAAKGGMGGNQDSNEFMVVKAVRLHSTRAR